MAEVVYDRYDRPYYYGYDPGVLVARVVNTIFGIIEFFIGLRVVLQLLGASSSSPFVAWVYSVTDALIAPFSGAFANLTIGGLTLDVSAIFAMIGYAIIGWLIVRLFSFLFASFT